MHVHGRFERCGASRLLLAALLSIAAPAWAQPDSSLDAELRTGIDSAADEVLRSKGVPSASIVVVKDGRIAYVRAYGRARLDPPSPASPTMRYAIGSISKQFVAASVALLVDEGRMTLDDPVSKYFPELPRSEDYSVRQLLSHTAGVRDYWPQDYLPERMREPITPREVMEGWATAPLDFEPGTRFQYSNTGYVIAGLIVEKVSGRPLFDFMSERIFSPLGMTSVLDFDRGRLASSEPVGYTTNGPGPQRPAPKEGPGWIFAAGGLAMTAEDLARWCQAMIEGRLLSPRSWRELTTEVRLASGVGTNYGLGLDVKLDSDRRVISHGGFVMGFTSECRVYPDDRVAMVVLTNDEGMTSGALADRIAERLFLAGSPADAEKLQQSRALLLGLQRGAIDRALVTPNLDGYFTPTVLKDCREGLSRLGSLKAFELVQRGTRGGLITRVYQATFAKQQLQVFTRATPEGKFESYRVFVN